jgi:hypothetical protein
LRDECCGLGPTLSGGEIHQFGGETKQSTNVVGIIQGPQSFAVFGSEATAPAFDATQYFGHVVKPRLIGTNVVPCDRLYGASDIKDSQWLISAVAQQEVQSGDENVYRDEIS